MLKQYNILIAHPSRILLSRGGRAISRCEISIEAAEAINALPPRADGKHHLASYDVEGGWTILQRETKDEEDKL